MEVGRESELEKTLWAEGTPGKYNDLEAGATCMFTVVLKSQAVKQE